MDDQYEEEYLEEESDIYETDEDKSFTMSDTEMRDADRQEENDREEMERELKRRRSSSSVKVLSETIVKPASAKAGRSASGTVKRSSNKPRSMKKKDADSFIHKDRNGK